MIVGTLVLLFSTWLGHYPCSAFSPSLCTVSYQMGANHAVAECEILSPLTFSSSSDTMFLTCFHTCLISPNSCSALFSEHIFLDQCSIFYFLIFFHFSERSHSVNLAEQKCMVILLPQLSKCRDYRYTHHAFLIFF